VLTRARVHGARAQMPQPWQFGPLTRACRADVAGDATDAAGAAAEEYAAYRYAVRTACKPAALDALDRVVRGTRLHQHAPVLCCAAHIGSGLLSRAG
jgi:hypothetical protein